MLCIEDNKSYFSPVSPVAKLESKDGLGLGTSDLAPGSIVIVILPLSAVRNHHCHWKKSRFLKVNQHTLIVLLVTNPVQTLR